MGCQTSVELGTNLVFSVCTHDPDTGVLTDADAVPAYRIYENETAPAILTGNMAKLDDVNTTGFYTETVACTTANGFDIDTTYTIYITASVGGDEGGICYAFEVIDPVNAASSPYTAVSGSHLTILRGDTWTASVTALGNIATRTKLWFTVKAQKTDADTAAVVQILESNPAVATDGLQRLNGAAATAAQGSITVTNAAVGDITITIDEAATALLREQSAYYDIQVLTAAGNVTTLATGQCDVNLDVTSAVA